MGPTEARAPRRSCLLAYFIYGSRREYQVEAAFSIATARRALTSEAGQDDIEIVVITDQTQFALPMDARIIGVSAEELAHWTQQGRYNHRAKLCALQRLLQEGADAAALVDTDTYWTGSPGALFARVSDAQSVMHADEGKVAEDSQWLSIFADESHARRLSSVGCTRGTSMFNSGVIALSSANAALATAALDWLDAEMENVTAFNIEQVAVSVALQRGTRVTGCQDLLVHYWGHERPFVHIQIAERLSNHQVHTDALGFPRATMVNRLTSRTLAALFRWHADCRFSYQAMLSARASHAWGDGFEHAWTKVAVDALERAHDVHGLEPEQVPGLRRSFDMLTRNAGWLDAQERQRWQRVWRRTSRA